jgi:hypothetical protein
MSVCEEQREKEEIKKKEKRRKKDRFIYTEILTH